MDGALVVEAGVSSVPVVSVELERPAGGAVIGVRVGVGIGPFPEGALDEASGLAVGAGRIGSGAELLEVLPSAEAGEAPRGAARTFVGHDASETDVEGGEVAQSCQQGPAGAGSSLAGVDGGEAHPRGVVDGDVDKLPSGSRGAMAPVAVHPVAGALEAPQLLDVQVQQVSRVRVDVAVRGRRSSSWDSRFTPARWAMRPTVEGATPRVRLMSR